MNRQADFDETNLGGSPTAALPAGTRAPEFNLRSTPDQSVKLSEFRRRPVILAFYPADWSPVCGDEMALYNEMLSEFQDFNAELFGISVDGRGVMRPSARIASYIFRSSPTLNRKERWRKLTESTVEQTVYASVLYLWLTARVLFTGPTFRRWA